MAILQRHGEFTLSIGYTVIYVSIHILIILSSMQEKSLLALLNEDISKKKLWASNGLRRNSVAAVLPGKK
jgi:hypothetical protein